MGMLAMVKSRLKTRPKRDLEFALISPLDAVLSGRQERSDRIVDQIERQTAASRPYPDGFSRRIASMLCC